MSFIETPQLLSSEPALAIEVENSEKGPTTLSWQRLAQIEEQVKTHLAEYVFRAVPNLPDVRHSEVSIEVGDNEETNIEIHPEMKGQKKLLKRTSLLMLLSEARRRTTLILPENLTIGQAITATGGSSVLESHPADAEISSSPLVVTNS
ncbi:unnamed protein product, partial [Protopolystoma xenopodis]